MQNIKEKKAIQIDKVTLTGMASLFILGVIVGIVLWVTLSSPLFFGTFLISYAFAIPIPILMRTMKATVGVKNAAAVGSVVGRYVSMLLAVGLSALFVWLMKAQGNDWLWLLVCPTVIALAYGFAILSAVRKGG